MRWHFRTSQFVNVLVQSGSVEIPIPEHSVRFVLIPCRENYRCGSCNLLCSRLFDVSNVYTHIYIYVSLCFIFHAVSVPFFFIPCFHLYCVFLSSGFSSIRFSTVVIDEATQATEAAALVPLVRGCQQLVLVGDQNQVYIFFSRLFVPFLFRVDPILQVCVFKNS